MGHRFVGDVEFVQQRLAVMSNLYDVDGKFVNGGGNVRFAQGRQYYQIRTMAAVTWNSHNGDDVVFA
jgi:hypothetical protein